MILVLVYVNFLSARSSKFGFLFRIDFQVVISSISESKFRRSGLQNQGFRMESIAKIVFLWISFLMKPGIDLCRFFGSMGAVVLVFWALKTDLKIRGLLVT